MAGSAAVSNGRAVGRASCPACLRQDQPFSRDVTEGLLGVGGEMALGTSVAPADPGIRPPLHSPHSALIETQCVLQGPEDLLFD